MARTFRSLRRQNLSAQVVREIGLSIMRKEFQPGDALLSEPELSQQFNVSRPVLREALKVLAEKGLIEARPRTGTRVRPRADWNLLDPEVLTWQYEVGPDPAFLEAICEVRLMFEPMTARLAASRATAEEIETIERACGLLEKLVEEAEPYIEADLAFHSAICAAAHNELLQRIVATLAAPLRASRLVTARLPGANRRTMPLHRRVAEAIRQGQELAAEEAMRELIVLTTEDVHRALGYSGTGSDLPLSACPGQGETPTALREGGE
ncbi:FadR/GntR family transcriptional regulator [Thermogemmatispora carboxidivorans]|uniref:FadR/GntR family transcriptional regulator n=1 Tax=Thermogemmatispora carboxidivorans TaxID=1382306 RepID=UPI0009DDFAA8|nr:FadR/GntR family transcriptional regulator [Thermogemmatispora carboxidivorans]